MGSFFGQGAFENSENFMIHENSKCAKYACNPIKYLTIQKGKYY